MSTATATRPASSLLTQAYLLDHFGLRLTIDQLAQVLHLAARTIYNQVSAGTFPVPTYVDGAKRFADYRDVATYLDDCRARARSPA
jgi:predicted DNA-binding transcriptional regulator AlpA